MKLTQTMFLTLDGVYQAPGGPTEDPSGGFEQGGWLMPYFDEAVGEFVTTAFAEADGFVLGRKTYDIFASHWPHVTDTDDPVAVSLNTLPKYVASSTLTNPEWQKTTVLNDAVAAVAELKKQPGRELQIHGSGALAQSLFDAKLIDTVRLLVFPVVLGAGKRLFAEGRTPSALRLVDVKTSSTGVTLQTFDLAGDPTYASVEPE